MILERNLATGDSTFREKASHYDRSYLPLVLLSIFPKSVEVLERKVTNNNENPDELEAMRKRWERAKRLTFFKS